MKGNWLNLKVPALNKTANKKIFSYEKNFIQSNINCEAMIHINDNFQAIPKLSFWWPKWART